MLRPIALATLWLAVGCGAPPSASAPQADSFLSLDRRTVLAEDVRARIVEVAHPPVEISACGGEGRLAVTIVGGTDPDDGSGYVLSVDGTVLDSGAWTVSTTIPEPAIDVLPVQDQVQGLPMRLTCIKDGGAELRTEVVTATSDGRVLTVEAEG